MFSYDLRKADLLALTWSGYCDFIRLMQCVFHLLLFCWSPQLSEMNSCLHPSDILGWPEDSGFFLFFFAMRRVAKQNKALPENYTGYTAKLHTCCTGYGKFEFFTDVRFCMNEKRHTELEWRIEILCKVVGIHPLYFLVLEKWSCSYEVPYEKETLFTGRFCLFTLISCLCAWDSQLVSWVEYYCSECKCWLSDSSYWHWILSRGKYSMSMSSKIFLWRLQKALNPIIFFVVAVVVVVAWVKYS